MHSQFSGDVYKPSAYNVTEQKMDTIISVLISLAQGQIKKKISHTEFTCLFLGTVI